MAWKNLIQKVLKSMMKRVMWSNKINLRSAAKGIMSLAAMYQVIWGLLALFLPNLLISWVIPGVEITPFMLQFLGGITFALGAGAIFVAMEPFRQWAVTIVSLLFFGISSLLFFGNLFIGGVSAEFMPFVMGNWVLWIIPYSLVLIFHYINIYQTDELLIDSFSSDVFPLELFETSTGQNLIELSEDRKTLLVFLRHFGCPFCKDTMDRLREIRSTLEDRDVNLVVVYMISVKEAAPILAKYGLSNVNQISDPEQMLYKKFRLRRGHLTQLFGLNEWKRFFQLLTSKGYLIQKEAGDSFQMPGIFVMDKGEVTQSFIHSTASQHPDLMQMVESV